MIERRALLGGGIALAAVGTFPAYAAPADLRAALDATRAERDPARALALLAGFDAGRIAEPGLRLDLLTARAGLATDAEIVRRFGLDPRGKGPWPRDAALFALLLRRKLGDTPALPLIERRLEAERTRLAARAGRLFDAVGVPSGATDARFSRLWQDPRYLYADSDAGRATLIADMNQTLARLKARLLDSDALFGPFPRYCLNVAAVRPSPTDEAKGHVGYRVLPTPTTPGGYFPDLLRVRARPSWTLPSVVAHELLPGHMLQMPMEVAAAPHPLRLDYAPVFPEAWAIYVERLVAELGCYAHDPLAELGYVHWRLFRLGRALTDIAINVHDTSPAEAQARLVRWQGEPAYFAPFASDIARMAADPGTRAGEMIAALAIQEIALEPHSGPSPRIHQALLRYGRMRTELIARIA